VAISDLANTTTIDVERSTDTADAEGGIVRSYAVLHNDIPATKQFKTGTIIDAVSKAEMHFDHIFYTTTAYSPRSGDRINESSVYYRVMCGGDQVQRGAFTKVYTKRIDQ
jgi:hypothetical protein